MMYRTKPIPAAQPAVRHVERPWGSFRQYAHNQETTVSLMTVMPGQRLSLQSHAGRAELWVVLDEGAVVQVREEERPCLAGEEVWIPAGGKHRLSCRGTRPVRVLEVAFGDWQQEDITRYEDDYQRAGAPAGPGPAAR
jgi:mannose-1-phosphate guanylyltransferase/mannose-6-phosphate isomerase